MEEEEKDNLVDLRGVHQMLVRQPGSTVECVIPGNQ